MEIIDARPKKEEDPIFETLPIRSKTCKRPVRLEFGKRQIINTYWYTEDPRNYGKLRDKGKLSLYVPPGGVRIDEWDIVYEDERIVRVYGKDEHGEDELKDDVKTSLAGQGFRVEREYRPHPEELSKVIDYLRNKWLLGQSPFKFDFAREPEIHWNARGQILIVAPLQQLSYFETVNVAGGIPSGGGPTGPLGYSTKREAMAAGTAMIGEGVAQGVKGIRQDMAQAFFGLAQVSAGLAEHTDDVSTTVTDQVTRAMAASDQKMAKMLETFEQQMTGANERQDERHRRDLEVVQRTFVDTAQAIVTSQKQSNEALLEALKQAEAHIAENESTIEEQAQETSELKEAMKILTSFVETIQRRTEMDKLTQEIAKRSTQVQRLTKLRDAFEQGIQEWIDLNETIKEIVTEANELRVQLIALANQ